jgi:hypothetical protein
MRGNVLPGVCDPGLIVVYPSYLELKLRMLRGKIERESRKLPFSGLKKSGEIFVRI